MKVKIKNDKGGFVGRKDPVLMAVQENISLDYETVKKIYDIINSYDAIIEVSDIAHKYNKNVIETAIFLFKDE